MKAMSLWIVLIIILIPLSLSLIVNVNKNKWNKEQQRREELRKKKEEESLSYTRENLRSIRSYNASAQSYYVSDTVLSEGLNRKTQSNNFADHKKINCAISGLFYRTYAEKKRARELYVGEEVCLEREQGNVYDKNATRVVTTDGVFVGYVDANYSQSVAMRIRERFDIRCFVSKITNDDLPFIYMDIYYKTTNSPVLTLEHRTTVPQNNSVSSKAIKTQSNIKYTDLNIDINSILNIDKLCKNVIIENEELKKQEVEYYFASLSFDKLLRETHDLRDFYPKPTKLLKIKCLAYEGDNDFEIEDEYECGDRETVTSMYSYHLETKGDRLYKRTIKLEDSMEIEKAIINYTKIINMDDIYPSIFCKAIWRLSVVLGKMRKYTVDVKILEYAIERLEISNYKQSEIDFLKNRMNKSMNKKSK